MTGRFAAAAVNATREAFGTGPLRRYDADLVVPQRERALCAVLKGIALKYVMRRRGTEPWYEEQREILTDLVEVLSERAPDSLDPVFGPLWKDAADDAARLRVVIDQVASLTDPAAIAWHRQLVRPDLA
jgi:dGTPase